MPNLLLRTPDFVHDGDTIGLIAGNNLRPLNDQAIRNLNVVAKRFRDKFGNDVHIILATAGMVNIRKAQGKSRRKLTVLALSTNQSTEIFQMAHSIPRITANSLLALGVIFKIQWKRVERGTLSSLCASPGG
jgi:hypothetical protein